MTANPFAHHELRNPEVTAAEALELTRRWFGIDGTATDLGSHQDLNFRIDAPEARYVLKVANSTFTRAELELQNSAMESLAGRLGVSVPQPVRALDGTSVVAADGHQLRLLTYVEGEPIQRYRHFAVPLLAAVGRIAADNASALAGFDHPAAERTLQWDLRQAGDVVAALAPEVGDTVRRALAERVMQEAAGLLAPLEATLPLQVIHGDITDWNIVGAPGPAGRPRPTGLIDFGDTMRSYRVAELAVAATSCLYHAADAPLQAACEVVRAFHAIAPLSEDEIDALWPLVLARSASVAVSTEQQALLELDNAYVTESGAYDWLNLELAAAVPTALARAALRAACGLDPHPRSKLVAELAGRLGPLVGLDAGAPLVSIDLSVTSDALEPGGWETADGVRNAVEAQTAGGVAVGRWGEARLVHGSSAQSSEPLTVHLGTDLFVPVGTPVAAPLAGKVVAVEEWGIVLEGEGLWLRLGGVEPLVEVGAPVGVGEVVARVAAALGALPPHLHVQLACEAVAPLPALAPASLRAAWLALCPDPSGLVGLDVRAPAPEHDRVLAERQRYVASPQVHYYSDPPAIERGFKHELYDEHGRAYVDVINNVAILGHSHPAVERAATRQLRLLNTNSRFLYGALPRFARRLADLLPDPLEVVLLVSSGSEANDLALRLAHAATGARDVLCVGGNYHGWTTATFDVSTSLFDNPLGIETRPPWIHAILSPNTYRGPHRGADAGERYAADAQRALDEVRAAGRGLSALIAEPVLGNQGGLVPPAAYTRTVVDLVRSAGGLYIADEVQVGYGRLGHVFWAFEHEGVVPDIVTIAKSTGNGYPVAAVITTREIADALGRDASWFSSMGGNPVACEVGLAVLDAMAAEHVQENARVVGDHLKARLSALVDRHALVGAVHGLGLYLGVELVRDRATREPAPDEAYALCERLRELGVIVQPTGDYENILKVKPPLVITRQAADFFVDQLDRALGEGW